MSSVDTDGFVSDNLTLFLASHSWAELPEQQMAVVTACSLSVALGFRRSFLEHPVQASAEL